MFKTSDLCKPTGIHLDNGGRYTVKVEPIRRGPGTMPAFWFRIGGFSPTDQPVWKQRIKLGFAVPLRRELTKDWFRIVLRYGDVGGEEAFLDPDPDDAVSKLPSGPTREGELFIFVNDAVIGIPGLYDYFYRNNQGRGATDGDAEIDRPAAVPPSTNISIVSFHCGSPPTSR